MPIYEYACEQCCARFEMKRRFGEDDGGVCPSCGSPARRLFSAAPIIFKGSGFYVTDSRKASPGESSEKSSGTKS